MPSAGHSPAPGIALNSLLVKPKFDPTATLDRFRAEHNSQLLVAAAVLGLGTILAAKPLTYDALKTALKLEDRAAQVLLTSIRAQGYIDIFNDRLIGLTELGREKLIPDSPHSLVGYINLGGFSPGAQMMLKALRENKPQGGASFVYHVDQPGSALDDATIAPILTSAMADRARNIAPYLVQKVDLAGRRHLLDVGGAHGIYSYAFLQRFLGLQSATIFDRKPALEVAEKLAVNYGVRGRVKLREVDIHCAGIPSEIDTILMANIIHDYDEDIARKLVIQFGTALRPGGMLIIVDAFLNPIPQIQGYPPISDGPHDVAAYSGLLFSISEGCCYRQDQYQEWIRHAGLQEQIINDSTLPAHGNILIAIKE